MVLGVWRLSSVTLTSQNWTPYIERVFEQIVPDSDAEIATTSLDWDHNKFTLSLDCEDINLRDKRKQTVMFFPKASLKINLWSLLRGHFVPEEFTADAAHFWLTRHTNHMMSLGSIKPDPQSKGLEEKVTESSDDFVDALGFVQNISDELADASFHHKIKIKSLAVDLYDVGSRRNWYLRVPELSLEHNKRSATGTARVLLKDGDKEVSAVQLTYAYLYDKRLHTIGASFQDLRFSSFAFFAPEFEYFQMTDLPVSGSFSVSMDKALNIAAADIKLDGEKGVITAPEMWEKDRPITKASFAAQYSRDRGKIEVTNALIDFGGPRLEVDLEAKVTTSFKHAWFNRRQDNDSYSLTLRMFDVPMDSFGQIWPKTAIPNARAWIIKNMTGGMFYSGTVTIGGNIDYNDIEKLTITSGGGELKAGEAKLTYLDGMPPIDDVFASAIFDLEKMDVLVEKGHTGDILIQPFTLRLDNFQKSIQTISIPLKLQGSVPDVLRLIDNPRLGYATKMGLVPEDNGGKVEGTLTISLPLLMDVLMDDVEIKAEAKVTDFSSPKLIPRIGLTKGNLDLFLTTGDLKLKGDINLNDVPAKIEWATLFNESKAVEEGNPIHQATVKAAPEDEEWSAFYGMGKYIRFKGKVPVTVEYKNIKTGESLVTVDANLGPAEVFVEQLAYHKNTKIPAQVSFAVEVNADEPITFNDILVAGKEISVKGSAVLDTVTSELTQVSLSPFNIGRHNAVVEYSAPTDVTLPMVLKITGRASDFSGIGNSEFKEEQADKKTELKTDKKKPVQAKDIYIMLSKLHMSEDGYIEDVKCKATRSTKGWEYFSFEGIAQGYERVTAELSDLKEGGKRLEIKADNLGLVLKGAGMGDSVKGGDLSVFAQSTAAKPYDLAGTFKTKSFAIIDWPFLTRLFSTFSPFGWVDLITGEASFSHLRGEFAWNGDAITMKNMNAPGTAIGLNFKGKIDIENSKVNVSGTAVPFSFVNKIIGAIPLIGDVITGGKGQGLLAVAFDVTGALSDPKIGVNPASLLTPGFLRNIFFSSDNETTDEKKIERKKAPEEPYPKNKSQ